MASWSTKRKYGYFFIFIVLITLVVGVPLFFLYYKAPTCFDGKQNGGERGVDCGGSCKKLCALDFASPRVLWGYSMRVVPGVYNALAYVQNPNQAVEANLVPYVFKFYDDKGLLITQKTGKTFVPAGQKFAVFFGGLDMGERIPARTTFEFTDIPAWRPGQILTRLKSGPVNLTETGQPKADVNVTNEAVDKSFSDIDVIIVLYDKDDNRVAFSKTFIETIGPGETQTVFFTWQESFSRPIIKTEVLFIPRPAK